MYFRKGDTKVIKGLHYRFLCNVRREGSSDLQRYQQLEKQGIVVLQDEESPFGASMKECFGVWVRADKYEDVAEMFA
jgi:hypothetical protein